MERVHTITKEIALTLIFTTFSFFLSAQTPIIKFLDSANMDFSVHPGNDFYKYANGNWIKNNPVPPSETIWGSFEQLREFNLKAVKTILERAAVEKSALPGTATKRVGDFYFTAMDTVAIEKRGADPIMPYLERIKKINDKKKLISEMNKLYTIGVSSHLFFINVVRDRYNANQMITRLGQWGITIDARDYYDKNEQRNSAIQENLKKYISSLFMLTGVSKKTAQQNAVTVFELEKKIAGAQIGRTSSGNTFNKFHINDLSKIYPRFNWQQTLIELKITGEDSIVINNPFFIQSVDSLLAAVSLKDWKIYSQWNILRTTVGYLSKPFIEAKFTFDQFFSGQQEQTPRWRDVASFIERYIGDLLGQLYVKDYFDPVAKTRTVELFNNLRKAFANRIHKLDWMSQMTKERALSKLNAMTAKIGSPEEWRNYDGLLINRQNYFENIVNISRWNYNSRISQLGKPINKNQWSIIVTEVDAYYNAVLNEIGFPAGRLQFPYFDKNADDAFNYGAIGAIIGHEMSHGFDENGSKYDADGVLRNWWTEEDRLKFITKTNELIKQYNNYTVQDSIRINGKLTLNENIADLCGLNVAYEAFKMTRQVQSNELIDGFTPDQRFFQSWAQIRRMNILPIMEVQQIKTDNHSPGQYRTIGSLVNMDSWYKAFNILPEHKLYKKPEDRIRIW